MKHVVFIRYFIFTGLLAFRYRVDKGKGHLFLCLVFYARAALCYPILSLSTAYSITIIIASSPFCSLGLFVKVVAFLFLLSPYILDIFLQALTTAFPSCCL
ncbi:hypothetical protein ABW19_dt0207608 [Dactylella cylindrospora]|nr:hypothetical protein ABW19_dt0207608 [Dactylella cylindrospora]